MGDIYFEVNKDSKLYANYFRWLEDKKIVHEAFKSVTEEFSIESKEFYPADNKFKIVPTRADREKFDSQMKKTSDGEFKKATEVHKRWVELVKNVKYFRRPALFNYFWHLGRWSETIWHDPDTNKVYGHIGSSEKPIPEHPETFTMIKGSEYHAIAEKIDDYNKAIMAK